ncbi:MAG: dephospho-CoA kinase [Eubacteriales bacterium]
MYTIGLTGSMGAGKSYAAAVFGEFGIQSIDTDMVSRQVTRPGTPCLEELRLYFGDNIITGDGTLDRSELAKIAFADQENTAILNKITHKHILAECRKWLHLREAEGQFAAVVQAPLLYESGFNYYCDYVVAVLCDTATKLRRIYNRDGIDEQAALARLSKQHDDRYFYNRADFTINNNNGENIRLQIDLIIQQIKFV